MGTHQNPTTDRAARHRTHLLIALAVTIVLGLASRQFHTALPGKFQKEIGDVLWGTAACFAVAILLPRWPLLHVAAAATVLAWISELSQLSHAGVLESLRKNTVGHLLLGVGFSWLDMAMYPIGVAIAWLVARGILARIIHHGIHVLPTKRHEGSTKKRGGFVGVWADKT